MNHRNQIICLGSSFHSAPLALRETLTVPAETIIDRFSAAATQPLRGLAVVTTCNRLELYASAPDSDTGSEALRALWESCLPDGIKLPQEATYLHTGQAAAQHLLRVAAGLDSMVLGEPQILGQVITGFELMQRSKTADADLTALFRTAIQVGKRARSETGISRNSVSVSSVGVQLLLRRLGSPKGKRILIIGAGETGRLALKALKSHPFAEIIIINRTFETAQRTAKRFEISAAPFESLPQLLTTVDGVITTTASPTPVITMPVCQAVERPLHIVDLAVPRDVAPEVRQLDQITVSDVDDLQHEIEAGLERRRAEIPAVEAIIEDELARYRAGQRETLVDPVLSRIRAQAETIRQREINRTLKQLGDLDPASLKHVEKLTKSLVSKLLHQPTAQLRAEARNGDPVELAVAATKLFNLEEG